MFAKLPDLALEVGGALLLLCDHVRGRIVHKIRIAQFGPGPVEIGLDLLQLLAEALALGINVDQALHRHEQPRFIEERCRCGRRFLACGEQGHGLDPADALEQRSMLGCATPVRLRCILEDHGQWLARRDIHFTADLPHPEDEFLEPLDVRDSLAVRLFGRGLRVRLQHDRLAPDAGPRRDLLPDLLG